MMHVALSCLSFTPPPPPDLSVQRHSTSAHGGSEALLPCPMPLLLPSQFTANQIQATCDSEQCVKENNQTN
jgi:hypothetical protein